MPRLQQPTRQKTLNARGDPNQKGPGLAMLASADPTQMGPGLAMLASAEETVQSHTLDY